MNAFERELLEWVEQARRDEVAVRYAPEALKVTWRAGRHG